MEQEQKTWLTSKVCLVVQARWKSALWMEESLSNISRITRANFSENETDVMHAFITSST
jgi:hypothetical protein